MVRGRGEEVRALQTNFSARRCCHKATRAPPSTLRHLLSHRRHIATSPIRTHRNAQQRIDGSQHRVQVTLYSNNIPSRLFRAAPAQTTSTPQWNRHLLESSQFAVSTLCAFTSSTEEPQFHPPGLRNHHQSHCHSQVSRKRDIQCKLACDKASAALFQTRARVLPPGRERGEAAHASQMERVSAFRGSSPSRAAVAIILSINTH